MSDDFDMDEDQDFDFDYESQEEESDSQNVNVDLENKYYTAKGLRDDAPLEAIDEFKSILDSEIQGDWGFKALKQLTKLTFRLNIFSDTILYYNQLLEYIQDSKVTRNYSEKSINNILELVGSCTDTTFLEQFYSITLSTLENQNNHRLLLKTNLKLAKVYLERREYPKLSKLLRSLHESLQNEDGSDDQKQGTTLLEIFALEIQMHTETKNNKKLKQVYQQCLGIKSAIPHPRIMGIIRECGGKMHMSQKEWQEAQIDFFEAFKNYDEAGSPLRITCLKYLVLANMLMESQINPFDSQETKPYKNDPQLLAITSLVSAYQRNEIKEFEKILREHSSAIMGDSFIKTHIDQVLKNIRSQVIINLIRPYTRIELSYISLQLNISIQEVEDLLTSLILDGRIHGKMDQLQQRLLLKQEPYLQESMYMALKEWSNNLNDLMDVVLNKNI